MINGLTALVELRVRDARDGFGNDVESYAEPAAVDNVLVAPGACAELDETRPEGGHPILYSKGPDGRAGTTDDVLPDQDAFEEPFRNTAWTNGWAPYRLRGIVVAPDEATKRRVQEEMKQYA